ncbi:MAG: hypothetical protein J5770_02235 [Bacteroidaceae bacterium]|nr:hypothetical protein [Bacteroidaceae bacterium]
MAVTSLAAQDKQRQAEAQQRLIELAKEVWKCFPTECDITSGGDMDRFYLGAKLPQKRFRPSLIDSLNVAFAEAIPTATYASAMKYNRLDNGKDSISYTMTWNDFMPNGHSTILRPPVANHHILPFTVTSNFNLALFDKLNDSIFFYVDLPHRKNRQTRYDISDFELMLEDVKKAYPSKHQKVKFPREGFPTLKGDKYVITCNADSMFHVLSQYVLRHYWYENCPMIAINYEEENASGYDVYGPSMHLLLFSSDHLDNERSIEFTVCADKLLLLELNNMHDKPDLYQYLSQGEVPPALWSPSDWIQKLEPELYQYDQDVRRQRFNNLKK